MFYRRVSIAVLSVSALQPACAQQACPKNTEGLLGGIIFDPSGAVIPHAAVSVTDSSRVLASLQSNAAGRWSSPCLAEGTYTVVVTAKGFEAETIDVSVKSNAPVIGVETRLKIALVETKLDIDINNRGNQSGVSNTLGRKELAMLADDPDDLQRQLQALAVTSGSLPGSAIIRVDGFQTASKLPPKSQIDSIEINPDLFSAEYEDPPYAGGRIDVFTKPGQDQFHGALSATVGPSALNARNPLSNALTPAQSQRYGLEFSGPLSRSHTSDLSLALEHRQIDESAVVNATVLDGSAGATAAFHQVVSTPQQLWISNLRTGFRLGQRNNLIGSIAVNKTQSANKGVGGLVLPEAGFTEADSEIALRFTETFALNANHLNSLRVGSSWKSALETPNSSSPQIAVAGAFIGGGAIDGAFHSRERDLEIDDDYLSNMGHHTVKLGVQLLGSYFHNVAPIAFNGAYTFGGGVAPVLDAQNAATQQTSAISGLEQYRRAQLGLAGGTPTNYTVTTGQPLVQLSDWTWAVYGEDQWNITPRVSMAMGLRYFSETTPSIQGKLSPRVGISFTPDAKKEWTFHARVGLFYTSVATSNVLNTVRLDGNLQRSLTLYSPSYNNPLSSQAFAIGQVRSFAPDFNIPPSFQAQFSVEHTFFGSWMVNANYYGIIHWDALRSRNVNAPLTTAALFGSESLAPRPGSANLNLFEYEPSGRFTGNLAYIGINHFSRHLTWISGYLYNGQHSNADTADFIPQSSYSEKGDFVRPTSSVAHTLFLITSTQMPGGISLSPSLSAASGVPYDLNTGFDNNGDGTFNDRPSFATTASSTTYNTRFGLLDVSPVGGDVPRNFGTQAATLHLDLSLSRDFSFGEHLPSQPSPYTLHLGAHAANLLNHSNYITYDGIVGTSQFGSPLTADVARRLDFGLRLSF